MNPDDLPRRFTSDEMRRILEAATTSESSGADLPLYVEGFTLAEIQEIAREVGIDPDKVARASRSMVRQIPLDGDFSVGAYQVESRFQRPLSSQEMRFAAQEADRFFKVEGQIRETPGYLEWHSTKARAFVGLVNEAGQTRVRVIVDRAADMLLGSRALGALGVVLMVALVLQTGGVLGAVGAATVAAVTVLVLRGFLSWRRSSAIRLAEELIELMAEGPISLETTHDPRRTTTDGPHCATTSRSRSPPATPSRACSSSGTCPGARMTIESKFTAIALAGATLPERRDLP